MLNYSLPICWPLKRILNVPLSAASGAMGACLCESVAARDAEWSVRNSTPMVPSAIDAAMRALKPCGNEFIRPRVEFLFMQSPSGKFLARRFVRRRAGARYSTPHGNPQSRRKASVPGTDCESLLRRGTADGPEYARYA